MRVIDEIAAERHRQTVEENWTPEHDDQWSNGALARAAGCYALNAAQRFDDDDVPADWPWARQWWKPKSPRRDLVRAAALIVAEIERMDRATVERMAAKLNA